MTTGSEYLAERANGEILPCELSEEVLSWLPVKDLLRFRAVYKAWKSPNLIDNSRFKWKQIKAQRQQQCSPSSLLIWRKQAISILSLLAPMQLQSSSISVSFLILVSDTWKSLVVDFSLCSWSGYWRWLCGWEVLLVCPDMWAPFCP